MVVGLLTTKLAIYHSRSLKDKRRVIKSLKERIRHRFNVSIAETDAVDACQSAVLSTVVVSNDAHFAKQCLQQVLNFIEGHREADLIDYSLELI